MTGFQSPNHTQTPNDLFDEHMRDMKETELKVVLAIIRKTFGFHRTRVRISLSDLQEITGLSRQGVISGAEAAELHGFITKQNDGGVIIYHLVVKNLDQVVKNLDQTSQKFRPPSIKEKKKEKTLSERKATAKERIEKQRASKGDVLDLLTENLPHLKAQTEMRQRVENALHRNLDWDSPRSPWNGYEKKLIQREKDTGETIERFMEWFNDDDFRKNGVIYLNPTKIDDWWLQAFEPEPEQPQYKKVRYDPEDDKKYAPPPKTKPNIQTAFAGKSK